MTTVDIYTRDYCGFCTRAVHLLRQKGIPFNEFNASKDPSKRAEMIQRSGRNTFPQVFVGNHHIGGSDDLIAADHSGELDAALGGRL